jgi:hypothetical protein
MHVYIYIYKYVCVSKHGVLYMDAMVQRNWLQDLQRIAISQSSAQGSPIFWGAEWDGNELELVQTW